MDNIWYDIIGILLMGAVAAFVIFLSVCLWYLAKYLKTEMKEWESGKNDEQR